MDLYVKTKILMSASLYIILSPYCYFIHLLIALNYVRYKGSHCIILINNTVWIPSITPSILFSLSLDYEEDL